MWVEGEFLERPHRFMARVQTKEFGVVEAHCPNSGALKDVCKVGAPVLLSTVAPDSTRKLRYTWEWVKDGDVWVGVHTHKANDWAYQAIKDGLIKELGPIHEVRREVTVPGHGRLDFLVNEKTFVEVKSVHWRKHPSNIAIFPDAVTARGLKHLNTLKHLVQEGYKAVLLFVVQRSDCEAVAPAWHVDPKFSEALVSLHESSVQCLAYACYSPYHDGGQGLSHPVNVLNHEARDC